ncbi:MAG: hypothetical protein AMJ46_12175 [Latescibacteria bacterium DG_63]|nr:MAG: hypothetical protein AMJ46_12175 [Latescibacteria bacterium DG_63]
MHARVDDQTCGVERIGKHLEQRQVPSSRRSFVSHEHEHRFALALLELHLGDTRPQPLDVAAEGVLQDVLPCTVETKLLRDFRASEKRVPRKLMNVRGFCAPVVSHYEFKVVPA